MKNLMLTVSGLALLAGAAQAQSIVVPAAERMASDHAPLGVRAGSFLIIPKVDLEETYNDNIYATSTNEKSDFITTIRPEIAARSNWNRHALNAVVRAENQSYADHNSEDQTNYLAAADGRIDVLRNTSVGGGVSFSHDHEERGDPNTIGSPVKPNSYETTIGRIGLYHGAGPVNARLDTEAKKLDYKNSYSSTGGLLNNSVRNRVEYAQSLRLGYQFDPRFEGFVKGTVDNRVYDTKAPQGRSNRGQTYVVGSAFDVTGKTKGEVYAGMTQRNYTNSSLKDIDEATWGGKVTWNASEMTTVIGSINRGIEETTIGASSGYVGTDYDATVQHALTRDILLKGNLGYTDNEYKGNAANQREDKIWTAGVGADYYINRCLKAGLSYAYDDRNSNVTGGDYTRNTVLLRLTATY